MNKIVIINVYFGKYPNYFDLFLESCKMNKKYDFLFVTDQINWTSQSGNNINFIYYSFKEFSSYVKKILSLDNDILSPYKNNEYKPLFGKIFKNYIKRYDYWGFCDVDMIFGNLNILEELFNGKYDKILINGHLSFQKNNKELNEMYKSDSRKFFNFFNIINNKEPHFYDEIFYPNLLRKNEKSIYEKSDLFADILPQWYIFKMPNDNLNSQYFVYNKGKIIRVNDNKEYIYIHLQKRSMHKDSIDLTKPIYIFPNKFSNFEPQEIKDNFRYRLEYCFKQIKKITFRKILIKIATINSKYLRRNQ